MLKSFSDICVQVSVILGKLYLILSDFSLTFSFSFIFFFLLIVAMNDNQNNGEEMTWKSLNDMITPTYSPSPSPTSTPLGVKRSRISRACKVCP